MIGKAIVSLLNANEDLLALVASANIYPYVINEDTALPAIVYTIDSLAPEYTKDGWIGDECVFSIVSFSDSFTSLQNIAMEVRKSLELESGVNAGITTERIYLTGQSEGYNISENVFLNRLTFSTIITGY